MVRIVSALSLSALGLLGASNGAAQQGDDVREVEAEVFLDRTPERCLSLNRINRTEVVDDQTILFFMRGGGDRVYQNVLPRDCNGLERNDRFMYSPFSNRLCSTDTITVLEQFGTRFERGFTCRLGEFHPLTELEAEDLLSIGDDVRRGGGSSVEVEQVELPDGEADADAEETDD